MQVLTICGKVASILILIGNLRFKNVKDNGHDIW